jgi:hypothetical protein
LFAKFCPHIQGFARELSQHMVVKAMLKTSFT